MNEADYALDLIERLKPSLPMIATPSKVLIANMRRREDNPVKLKPKQRLKIEVCHYAGAEGGIACGYMVKDQLIISSLTHLKLDPKHPLYKEMRAYQLARIDYLVKNRLRNDGLLWQD